MSELVEMGIQNQVGFSVFQNKMLVFVPSRASAHLRDACLGSTTCFTCWTPTTTMTSAAPVPAPTLTTTTIGTVSAGPLHAWGGSETALRDGYNNERANERTNERTNERSN